MVRACRSPVLLSLAGPADSCVLVAATAPAQGRRWFVPVITGMDDRRVGDNTLMPAERRKRPRAAVTATGVDGPPLRPLVGGGLRRRMPEAVWPGPVARLCRRRLDAADSQCGNKSTPTWTVGQGRDLNEGDPVERAEQYAALVARHPHLTVLGGCELPAPSKARTTKRRILRILAHDLERVLRSPLAAGGERTTGGRGQGAKGRGG